jgi:hypothetical protein
MHKLFPEQGHWYKGNLHTHTTRSDGELAPQAVISLYRKAGYDFLALTDHWRPSENEEKDGMLLLAGCEWDTGDMEAYPIYHIIGAGMDDPVALEHDLSMPPQQIVDAVLAAGGVAVLAHPKWSVMDPAGIAQLQGICGAEVYNSVSGLPWNGARADSSFYFDLWATAGRLVPCMGADDSHHYTGEQTMTYTMVNAAELTRASLLDAIRKGRFYASQGPRFEQITITDSGTVEVHCSGAKTAVFYSNCVWAEDRVQDAAAGCVSYRINPVDRYIRVELIDENGRRAWSSPAKL